MKTTSRKAIAKAILFYLPMIWSISCSRQNLSDINSQKKKSESDVSANLLPGPCPYDCHDTRCKAYAGGYCGPAPTDTISVFKNGNNPYDYIGNQHNNGVEYVLKIVNPNSPTLAADIFRYSEIYAKSLGYDTSGANPWYTYVVSNNYFSLTTALYIDSANALDLKLYNNAKISSYANSYLNSLNATIDNNVAGGETPTLSKYNLVASQIVTVESQIKNDSRLSSAEKNGLLGVAAVLRYTGAYWANYLIAANGGGIISSATVSVNSVTVQPDLRIFRSKWWKRFWHADGVGALTGGAAGAPGGWAGFAWGAIIGGVSNSAAYAIFGD